MFICVHKETSQAAGPLQGHGERSPEGGAVRKENAKEEKESLKNKTLTSLSGLKMHVCWCLLILQILVCMCVYVAA